MWKDVRADPDKPVGPNGELCGIRTDAALPRTAKQVLDEDLPGMGQFYCKLAQRYLPAPARVTALQLQAAAVSCGHSRRTCGCTARADQHSDCALHQIACASGASG